MKIFDVFFPMLFLIISASNLCFATSRFVYLLWKSSGLVVTLKLHLNFSLGFEQSSLHWYNDIGWRSYSSLMATRNKNQNFEKNSRFASLQTGFNLRMALEISESPSDSIILTLYKRSTASMKGQNPVPPATKISFPGGS